jgi:PPOX class probable F420-dependent enzyme
VDRKTESKLKRELIVWLVTTGRDLKPQSVPVWFLWTDGSFLIYAQDGVKVRHIRENPNVELHLDTDEVGDVVVRASGKATLSRTPPANTVPAYVRKYGAQIKGFGWTPEEFARRYPHVVRIKKPRFH